MAVLLSCRFRLRPLSHAWRHRKTATLARPPGNARLAGFCYVPFRYRSSRHRDHAPPPPRRRRQDAASLPQVQIPATPSATTALHYAKPTRLARRPTRWTPKLRERAQFLTLRLRCSCLRAWASTKLCALTTPPKLVSLASGLAPLRAGRRRPCHPPATPCAPFRQPRSQNSACPREPTKRGRLPASARTNDAEAGRLALGDKRQC